MSKFSSPRAPRVLATVAAPARAVEASRALRISPFAIPVRLFGVKPLVILGVLLALVIVDAGAAYGSVGNLDSGAGTAATPVVANQTTRFTPMYPGDLPQTISGNFDVSKNGSSHVSSVTASISSVVKAPGASAGVCDATDFTLAHATMPVNQQLRRGTGEGAFTGATLHFNDKSTNQDQCKLAIVNLTYAIA